MWKNREKIAAINLCNVQANKEKAIVQPWGKYGKIKNNNQMVWLQCSFLQVQAGTCTYCCLSCTQFCCKSMVPACLWLPDLFVTFHTVHQVFIIDLSIYKFSSKFVMIILLINGYQYTHRPYLLKILPRYGQTIKMMVFHLVFFLSTTNICYFQYYTKMAL